MNEGREEGKKVRYVEREMEGGRERQREGEREREREREWMHMNNESVLCLKYLHLRFLDERDDMEAF